MGSAPRPRSPGIVFGALCILLAVLLAALTLTSRQPPPPTIAEFAPQAVENITDAPTDQSSSSGKGRGDQGAQGAALEAPTPTPTQNDPIQVPRVRRCIGDPPRQIEDPQSPPCVPYWAGDNGGATSKGVTADEIRIAAPNFSDGTHPRLQSFFNKRFEFYGRQIKIINTSQNNGSEVPAQQANAVRADEQHKVFASLSYNSDGGAQYHKELVRRRIVSASYVPNFSEPQMRDSQPYLWQYPMGVDTLQRTIGRWTCARLAGKLAVHAGGLQHNQPRVFGIILDNWTANGSDFPLNSEPLKQVLAGCSIKVAIEYKECCGLDQERQRNIMLQMKQSGVTSIICMCHVIAIGLRAPHATQDGYFPEWLLSTYEYATDDNFYLRGAGAGSAHLAHTFGLTMQPRQLRPELQASTQALREADPGFTDSGSGLNIYDRNLQYRVLLLVASGIQMAGPRLTPQSFEAGLHRTVFPNPQTPLQAGRVGFQARAHAMTLDAAEWWWSNTDRGPYSDDRQGTICYVDGGLRRTDWPAGDPFFSGACDSGA